MIDFTLIIPTKNRNFHLKNLLNYYSKTKVVFTILILDSSTGQFKVKNKKIVKNLKNLKILHKLIKGKPHEVVKKNIKFIKSKYCCLSGDDDYLYIDNIKKIIFFLERNKFYVGAGGISYLTRLYKDTFSFKKFSSTNLEQNYSVTRLKKHLLNYVNPHYSICKTSVFVKAINFVNKTKFLMIVITTS